MARLTSGAAVAAAVGVVALACSGGGGGGGGSSGSLRSALASVRDNPTSERYFAWSDGKELRTLTGVAKASDASKAKANQRWLRLAGVAVPAAAQTEPQLTDATGIDVYAADRAVTVGVAPDRASRVDGADGPGTTRKFLQLGAREQRVAGHTYLAVADEGQVDVSNPRLGNDVYLILNRVYVNGSTVAFGLADPPIETVLGGGRALADVPADGAVADCLGDVFVAVLMAPPPGSPDGVSLIGVGVRRPAGAGAPVTEVVCEVARDGAQAGQVAGVIRNRVAPDARLPGSPLQIRDRVAQAAVDQTAKGGMQLVRLTLDLVTQARAGFLMVDAGPGVLAFLAGGAGPPGG